MIKKWFIKLFGLETSSKNVDQEYIWCLVGNIIESNDGFGTKKFRAGAKVYCFPPLWGDGYEKIKVIGLPKKSRKKITIIIKSKLITNWRKQKVFDPFIIDTMIENGGWDKSSDSEKNLNNLLDSLKNNRTKN